MLPIAATLLIVLAIAGMVVALVMIDHFDELRAELHAQEEDVRDRWSALHGDPGDGARCTAGRTPPKPPPGRPGDPTAPNDGR